MKKSDAAYSVGEAQRLFEYIQDDENLAPDFRDYVVNFMSEQMSVNQFCDELDGLFADAHYLLKHNSTAEIQRGDDLRDEERNRG